jgi:hypothetical protein
MNKGPRHSWERKLPHLSVCFHCGLLRREVFYPGGRGNVTTYWRTLADGTEKMKGSKAGDCEGRSEMAKEPRLIQYEGTPWENVMLYAERFPELSHAVAEVDRIRIHFRLGNLSVERMISWYEIQNQIGPLWQGVLTEAVEDLRRQRETSRIRRIESDWGVTVGPHCLG